MRDALTGADTDEVGERGSLKDAAAIPLTWGTLRGIIEIIASRIESDGLPDVILAIQRGGLIPSVMLSHRLKIREVVPFDIHTTVDDGIGASKTKPVVALNSCIAGLLHNLDVLVVDDVVGSGRTLETTKRYVSACNPKRIRTATCAVNRTNWTSSNKSEVRDELTYIGVELDAWVVFPWEIASGARTVSTEIVSESQASTQGEAKNSAGGDGLLSNLYSMSQMDNFYETFATGRVTPSGVMNYIQHLFIAQRIAGLSNSTVLDMCCGRGLLLPLVARYAPSVLGYVGVDISIDHLKEARVLESSITVPRTFPVRFAHADVTNLADLPDHGFTIIAYTSALEHLPKDDGIKSLREASRLLAPGGVLYLSTPRTDRADPMQYRVHVYEWDRMEIEDALVSVGLRVVECIGQLPPAAEVLKQEIVSDFGEGAGCWYEDMRAAVPDAFLQSVLAAAFPKVAKELMFVCRHQEGCG